MTPPRIVYTDLDGTLLGPGGSLVAGTEGPSIAAAEALTALARAGIAVVPVSGRTEPQVREAARVVGAVDWIAELGGVTFRDGRRIVNAGAHSGEGSAWEAMARDGSAGLLLERYAGRLEPHAPWAFMGRVVTMLFRGQLDVEEATAFLEESGSGWLHVVDNGAISHPGPTEKVNAYHLAPRGVDKAVAISEDLDARGMGTEEGVLVGDGPSEAAVARHVRTVYIVANGESSLRERASNLRVTRAPRGEGFAEAVAELLAS